MPLAASTFVPLKAEHAELNVQVDVAAIGAFGFFPPRPEAQPLLYADLQCNADGHVRGRLGSGRSGFYRGKYLKGVGRTTLAGNWLDDDQYHASGHMLATAATREWLVTRYVEARGGGASIVGCEGLLARPLPDHDPSYLNGLGGRNKSLRLVDRRLQAVTIKDGHFARLSNVLWALNNFGVEPGWLAQVLQGLYVATRPDHAMALPGQIGPAELADGLLEAFSRGLANFSRYRHQGVDWGSFHNNFTADGRFLDLEVPTVVSPGFVGVITRHDRGLAGGSWIGLDVTRYVRQFRLFLSALRNQTRWLQCNHFQGVAAELLGELDRELERSFPAHHLVHDDGALTRHLIGELLTDLPAGPREQHTLRRIVERFVAGGYSAVVDDLGEQAFTRLEHRPLHPEGGENRVLYAPTALLEVLDLRFETARQLDELTRACDAAAGLDAYFAALGIAGAWIHEHVD